MNIDSLRYFIEVIEQRSITAAAKRLFVSPQGLSSSISKLEDEMRVKLTERSSHGTLPTSEGEVFLDFAKQTVASYDRMQTQFRAQRRKSLDSVSVSIGATPHALHTLLDEIPLDEEFFQVRLNVMSPTAILEALSHPGQGGLFVIDLVEGSPFAAQALESYAFAPILNIQMGIVRHVDFPLEESRAAKGDLLGVPLALFDDEALNWIVKNCFEGGQLDNVVLRTTNSAQIRSMMLAKRAVALLDSCVYRYMIASSPKLASALKFTVIEDMPGVTTGFLRRCDVSPNAAEALIAEELADALMRHEHACPTL